MSQESTRKLWIDGLALLVALASFGVGIRSCIRANQAFDIMSAERPYLAAKLIDAPEQSGTLSPTHFRTQSLEWLYRLRMDIPVRFELVNTGNVGLTLTSMDVALTPNADACPCTLEAVQDAGEEELEALRGRYPEVAAGSVLPPHLGASAPATPLPDAFPLRLEPGQRYVFYSWIPVTIYPLLGSEIDDIVSLPPYYSGGYEVECPIAGLLLTPPAVSTAPAASSGDCTETTQAYPAGARLTCTTASGSRYVWDVLLRISRDAT
jgi:hypothetical protein